MGYAHPTAAKTMEHSINITWIFGPPKCWSVAALPSLGPPEATQRSSSITSTPAVISPALTICSGERAGGFTRPRSPRAPRPPPNTPPGSATPGAATGASPQAPAGAEHRRVQCGLAPAGHAAPHRRPGLAAATPPARVPVPPSPGPGGGVGVPRHVLPAPSGGARAAAAAAAIKAQEQSTVGNAVLHSKPQKRAKPPARPPPPPPLRPATSRGPTTPPTHLPPTPTGRLTPGEGEQRARRLSRAEGGSATAAGGPFVPARRGQPRCLPPPSSSPPPPRLHRPPPPHPLLPLPDPRPRRHLRSCLRGAGGGGGRPGERGARRPDGGFFPERVVRLPPAPSARQRASQPASERARTRAPPPGRPRTTNPSAPRAPRMRPAADRRRHVLAARPRPPPPPPATRGRRATPPHTPPPTPGAGELCSRSSPANGSHRRPGLLFLPPGEDGEGRRPRGKAGRPGGGGGERAGCPPAEVLGDKESGGLSGGVAAAPVPGTAGGGCRRGSGRQAPRGGPGTAGGSAGTPLPSPRGNGEPPRPPCSPRRRHAWPRSLGTPGAAPGGNLRPFWGEKPPSRVALGLARPSLAYAAAGPARGATPPQAAPPLPPSISFLPLSPPEVHPEGSLYP
ncbi:basic proline-rich protein-like [Haliaeetus albicilla]|uniref:basic proline-rich protein-like n=1 Tax=Haliaeetus albicilla TaxID=8969 RepID=UPI0037E7B364